MKKSRSSRSQDVVRLARLYGCGVPGLKKVSKASKRNKNCFFFTTEDFERCNAKLKSSDFFISNGVESFVGFENYYISLLDLNDLFDKSFQVKFTTSEIAAFVQELQCTELDSFREIKIIFNSVLKELKLLGNVLRTQHNTKIRKDNDALLEFRLKHVEVHEEEHIDVVLDPPVLFNVLWEIHDACRQHWELKTKKFLELLHNNFNTPTGVVDGDKLREFLWYNIDAKVSTDHCKMLILYINGIESRLSTTLGVHMIVMTLKLLAQGRQCMLTPPVEDEDSYRTFCGAVARIREVLTNQSRAARIMQRTAKISKREEKMKKMNLPGDVFAIPVGTVVSSQSLKAFDREPPVASKPLQKKPHANNSQLTPIENDASRRENAKKVMELSSSLKKEETGPVDATSQKKTKKKVGIAPTCSSGSGSGSGKENHSKMLAPYVAHSTDVSRPGGSSILRAKTPLILDRPSNIRDRMALSLASDEGSVASASQSGGKKQQQQQQQQQQQGQQSKEHRLELCPVQLDEKGRGLRYDLRYRCLAAFLAALTDVRKLTIDDIMQAFWARKQCEVGVGSDIISEGGVLVDRKCFVEVLGVVLPRFFDANNLFSALDPNRSGSIAIHSLHALVSLQALPMGCEAWQIVHAALRAATWEVLNCRLHRNSSIRSTLSTAHKASSAAQLAAQQHLAANASIMQEKELQVKLEASTERLKDHLKRRVAQEVMAAIASDSSRDGDEVDDGLDDAQREAAALKSVMLPAGTLNACLRAVCTSPESEKKSSLSIFILVKKAQGENLWDEEFASKHRGYAREDVGVGVAMQYLNDNEDEAAFLKGELLKMQAKVNAHAVMGSRRPRHEGL